MCNWEKWKLRRWICWRKVHIKLLAEQFTIGQVFWVWIQRRLYFLRGWLLTIDCLINRLRTSMENIILLYGMHRLMPFNHKTNYNRSINGRICRPGLCTIVSWPAGRFYFHWFSTAPEKLCDSSGDLASEKNKKTSWHKWSDVIIYKSFWRRTIRTIEIRSERKVKKFLTDEIGNDII